MPRPPEPFSPAGDNLSGAELLTVTARSVQSDTVVVAAHGEVDLGTSPLLQDRLLAHLHDHGPRLIIDLTDVGFFGAAGLSVLVIAQLEAAAAGVTLRVVARTRPVLRLLTLTGVDRFVDVHPNLVHACMVERPDHGR